MIDGNNSSNDGSNGDDYSKKVDIGLTISNVTTLLGQDFAFEVYIGDDGKLFLSIDGEENPDKYLEVIAKKTEMPIHTIIPLILTNYSLVFHRDTVVKETSPLCYSPAKPTIH